MDENKRTKAIMIAVAAVAVIAVGGIGYGVYASGHVELKSDKITAEYAETLSTKASDYFKGNSKALSKVKIDVSGVDVNQVGDYKVKATKGSEKYEITVNVKDTVSPVLSVKKNSYVVVGKELSSKDIIKSATDLAGIKDVSFKEAQVKAAAKAETDAKTVTSDTKTDKKDALPAVSVKYDKVGTQENVITVIDENGNKTEAEIVITVVPESVSSLKGLSTDLNVMKDAKDVNYTKGVTYDSSKIKSVTVDSKNVDTSKAGEYEIVYIIKTVKDETIKIPATVTVVTPDKAQEIIKGGDTVFGDGDKDVTKEEADKKAEDTKKDNTTDTSKDTSKDTSNKDTTNKDSADKNTTDKGTTDKGTSNGGSSGNTSGNTSNSGNTNSGSTSDSHTHNWVEKTKVIHHDATGHNVHHDATGHNERVQTGSVHHEAVGHSEGYYICNDCGMENPDEDHVINHVMNGGTGSTRTASRWVEDSPAWDEPVYGDQWVQDTAAYDEWVQDTAAYDETVSDGYACSSCGATK